MQRYAKSAAALAGVLGQLVALGLLHGRVLVAAQCVLAVATVLGVYSIPNQEPKK